MSTLAQKLAHSMLAEQGLATIWKLHADAATLYRIGNVIAANSFIEIADLAESEWLQQTGGTAEANAP